MSLQNASNVANPYLGADLSALFPPVVRPRPGEQKVWDLHTSWLIDRVEAMSALPSQKAQCAYTHRRAIFVAFINGQLNKEGAVHAPSGEPGDMAENTLTAIRAYAKTIPGPHLLVWRIMPCFEVKADGLELYCRLAFDTDTDGGQ